MTAKKIKLLVIEDNPLLREGIARMLKSHRDITILAAPTGDESPVLKTHRLKPNVILLDLGLRSQNSLHIVEVLKKEFPAARIIVMDLAPAQGDILQFIRAGASGFILKDATLDVFLDTIRAVSAGTKVLPPLLNDSVFSQIVEHAIRGGKPALKGRTEDDAAGTRRHRADQRRDNEQADRPPSPYRHPHGEKPRPQHHGEARAALAP